MSRRGEDCFQLIAEQSQHSRISRCKRFSSESRPAAMCTPCQFALNPPCHLVAKLRRGEQGARLFQRDSVVEHSLLGDARELCVMSRDVERILTDRVFATFAQTGSSFHGQMLAGTRRPPRSTPFEGVGRAINRAVDHSSATTSETHQGVTMEWRSGAERV